VLEDAEAARQTYELLTPYAELPAMGSLAVVCLGSTHRAAMRVGPRGVDPWD